MSQANQISNKVLADKFNDYFTSITERSHETSAFEYLPALLKESTFLCTRDEDEVIRICKSFKMSKSEDLYGVNMEPNKHVIDLFSP